MTNGQNLARLRMLLVGLMVAFLATVASPGPVSAHTDFHSSVPADGSTVDGPLTTVTVNFTNPAVESGDGFELLGPDGVVREPVSLDPTDGTTFIATFDPPLEAGAYGFRWDVQAGDAHPIQGSFQFTVVDPPTTTDAAPDTAPSSGSPTETVAPVDDVSGDSPDAASLEAFLDSGDDTGSIVGRVGRSMSTAGTIFAVGVIAALVAFVRGRRDELRSLIGWVRLAGFVIIAGGITEFAALDETQTDGVVDVMGTKPGVAAVLTVLAGALIFVGFGDRSGKVAAVPRSLSSAAVVEIETPRSNVASSDDLDVDVRWSPDATAAVGIAGLVLGLVSYWFDGHTVSRGPWLVHAVANLVHVASASVWVGGVFAMTTIAVLRRRREARTGLAAMVVRFSTIAAISLGALATAGLVMTWFVIEGPSDLWSTDWGQVLLAKVVVVAIAAGMGAYNHLSLRPALEERPTDPSLVRHLRTSLAIESAAFVVVIVLTAILVGSAT